jgi:hypothetical protein
VELYENVGSDLLLCEKAPNGDGELFDAFVDEAKLPNGVFPAPAAIAPNDVVVVPFVLLDPKEANTVGFDEVLLSTEVGPPNVDAVIFPGGGVKFAAIVPKAPKLVVDGAPLLMLLAPKAVGFFTPSEDVAPNAKEEVVAFDPKIPLAFVATAPAPNPVEDVLLLNPPKPGKAED